MVKSLGVMVMPAHINVGLVGFRGRAYVFIDGGYIRGIIKNSQEGEEVLNDAQKYGKFLTYLTSRYCSFSENKVIRTLYYDAIVSMEDDPKEHREQREFFNKLQLIVSFFEVKLGDLVKSGKGGYRQKGVDTLIAIDMITKAYLDHYDVAILVTGDRDFVNVVKAVKDYTGKIVYGVYEPAHVSEELLRVLDWKYPMRKEDLQKICIELTK